MSLLLERYEVFLIFNSLPTINLALNETNLWYHSCQIIPQAICSRYGLAVGANFVGLVRVLMIICYPIAYPIGRVGFQSWILNFYLGNLVYIAIYCLFHMNSKHAMFLYYYAFSFGVRSTDVGESNNLVIGCFLVLLFVVLALMRD